ncbi:hypothetical protein [Synechococcus sp. 1G10]|uniref:hypothetical protein n=1 Tax=Synechococcus sp. 1G10 TaxID=2025605 RepID=UPI00117FCBAE|nr:hypothetical protein [Synechococcus sp. 1G10]
MGNGLHCGSDRLKRSFSPHTRGGHRRHRHEWGPQLLPLVGVEGAALCFMAVMVVIFLVISMDSPDLACVESLSERAAPPTVTP